MHLPPKTFEDLFEFYNGYVKILYSSIQIENRLPFEVLFELNAALDHIARKWAYDEPEEKVVLKAYSHLKRSCLDIFKLQVKRAIEQYKEIRKIDTSIIDNGDFDNKLMKLINDIKQEAKDARKREGDKRYDTDEKVLAFEIWQPVFDKAVRFEKDFYEHPQLDWAKRKNRFYNFRTFLVSIIASVIAGFFSRDIIINFLKWLVSLFQ